MSFQHEYPYGDVHELNLDWIIQTMQEFINSEREAGNTPTVSSVRSFFTHKYPYGDIHELNLDWVIQTALRMEEIGDSVEGDIGALQTRMTAAEGNISTLDNTVSGLSDSIDEIGTEIENINDDVEELQTAVTQHTTQIEELDEKIDEQVVANPADAATDTLSKIEIAGTVYTVEGSGGSEVEANPAGEPTDTLETIGIDGTIYEVGGSEPVSKTATGNPINITDAADAPIVSGEVTFEPKQDLHGYDKPWAGGAGKNKLPMSLTSIKNANVIGTWSDNVYSFNDSTYTVNLDNNGNVTSISQKNISTTVNDSFLSISIPTDSIYGNYNFDGGVSSNRYIFVWDRTTNARAKKWDSTTNSSNSADTSTFQEVKLVQNNNIELRCRVETGTPAGEATFYPMICASTETDPAFEPYSNICPIEGYTVCEIEVTDDDTTPTVTNTYTIDLDGTRYGGRVYPVTGKMPVGMGHIASYAGETIGEPWLSDRDEYVAGTTPTTGAEVVYTLASPTIVQLTPEQIRTLEGTNNISTNMTGMTLEYITQDYQPLVKLIERSAGHYYSTQERVVGTWIDGKPVYEQTFNVSSVTANDTWQEIANVGLKLLINFECISYSSTESGKETSFNNSKNAPQIKGNSSSGKLFYALVTGTSISGLYVTARYTKTTD